MTENKISHLIIMPQKMKNYLKNIHQKPEEEREKIMWVAVIFFMIVILGGLFVNFKSGKKINQTTSENPPASSLHNLQESVKNVNQQKEDLLEEISDVEEKALLEEIDENNLEKNKSPEESL